jgi:hypothetical protein
MLTYLRYALSTFCFAASVGCLGLWVQGMLSPWCVAIEILNPVASGQVIIGEGDVSIRHYIFPAGLTIPQGVGVSHYYKVPRAQMPNGAAAAQEEIDGRGMFGQIGNMVFFPLWYPALIFALAGVAALRLGCRFTLRSAIIATTVVAGLLGMAVAL